MPRDYKQVHNVRDHVKAGQRLSKDGLTNLHVITYDTPDFIHHIQTLPGLVVVAGRDDVLNEMASLLHHCGKTPMQLLSYDTTFCFGDFYLSVLLFRGICFHENPVIPALFMLHDDKRRDTHEIVARILLKKIPGVNSRN